MESSGDGDAFGGGAPAGGVAPVGGEAGAVLLEDPGEEGLGVAYGVAADASPLGIDREHELTAPGRAAVAGVHLARLEAEEIADEGPREELDHEGDGGPLVASEGELRAASTAAGSVAGLPSVSILHPSGIGFPSRWWIMISPCARARSQVEDERRTPLAARPRERHRVGAVERLRAPGRCHVRHRGHEREADEPALRESLRLRPQGREVVGVGDREGRDPLLAGQGNERFPAGLEGKTQIRRVYVVARDEAELQAGSASIGP